MGLPSSPQARLFYRCALQRFDEAKVLLGAELTTGAVYLAGYGVECILKALVLTVVSDRSRSEMELSFRGNKAHDFEWLRSLYLENGGDRPPRQITKHFTQVNDWSTDLRYSPKLIRRGLAEAFMTSSSVIIQWADGRL